MKKRLMIFAFAALITLPAAALAETWNIDPAHSSVTFKVRHFFTKFSGSFTEIAGTIDFDPGSIAEATATATIPVASIQTHNDQRDGHLKSPEFFDLEQYPELSFKSTKFRPTDKGLKIDGLLTMRGVEKPVTFDAEFLGSGPDMWGGTRAGFTASTKINRKDWGISWNKSLDKGGAVLGEEVEIELEIEGVLAAEK